MRMTRLPKGRRILLSLTILTPFLLAQLMTATTASAAAPSIYGWWSQTSLGAAGPTSPPDVPPDGMFVQNLLSGPIALSALKFTIRSDGPVDKLTLHISGMAVISGPPVACSASSAFAPAQGGSWSNRPSYDCTKSAPGVVSADKTQVVFAVRGLITSQRPSVVVLAGGATDRIAFKKPGLDALSVTTSGTLPSPQVNRNSSPLPRLAVSPPLPATPQQAPPPQSPAKESSAQGPPPQNVLGAAVDDAGQRASARRSVGTTLGVILLLLLILYWSDGFGLVPLRSTLVARARRKRG